LRDISGDGGHHHAPDYSAKDSRLYLYHTALPEALSRVEVRNLRIRDAVIDIAFERYAETVGINVLRRTGNVEILASK